MRLHKTPVKNDYLESVDWTTGLKLWTVILEYWNNLKCCKMPLPLYYSLSNLLDPHLTPPLFRMTNWTGHGLTG